MSDAEQFDDEMSGVHEPGNQPNEEQSAATDLELFEQYLEQDLDLDLPGRGDLREGVIVEIRPSELLVNVGSKRDGVVPQSDLTRLDPEFVKNLHEGQTVDVVISKQPDDDGIFVLSMADALQQRDWVHAQELMDNGEITSHSVVGYNKGGLTVEFNHLRGFVPASHIVDMPRNLSEEQRRTELEERIGRTMRLKVIEVERRRRRLVMSESLAEREYQAIRREELFKTLTVGDIITGEVRSLRPFGAFIDIGGADGLLHVSEIGWSNINHPRESLDVGQVIDVQVIRIDSDNQRIGLSRKRLLANPWDSVEERYKPGDTIDTTITRIVDFGAFAELEPGIEGLIHISEVADIAVAEPLKTIRVGDQIRTKVLRVDRKRQRVGLSLRQAEGYSNVDGPVLVEGSERGEEVGDEEETAMGAAMSAAVSDEQSAEEKTDDAATAPAVATASGDDDSAADDSPAAESAATESTTGAANSGDDSADAETPAADDAESTDTESTDTESTDTESTDTESTDTESTDTESTDTESNDTEGDDAKTDDE